MEFKDYLQFLPVGVSLGWNLVNSILVQRNWYKNNSITDFRKLREPVDKSIRELITLKRELKSLQLFGGPQDNFIEIFEDLNKRISKVYNMELSVGLEVLDGSAHVNGNDWQLNSETKWEVVADEFNKLYSDLTLPDRRKTIKTVETALDCLVKSINGDLDKTSKTMTRFVQTPSSTTVSIWILLVVATLISYGFWQQGNG